MAEALLGSKALDRKLAMLGRSSAKKAITAGIRAGMTPVAKAMRAAINAADASTALKRKARAQIGKRFAKAKGGPLRGQQAAKVGFSVGKKAEARSSGRGVGVGKENIHWFVLGTDERYHKETGRWVGRIPAIFEGVTGAAIVGGADAALAAARKKIAEVIKREALKKG